MFRLWSLPGTVLALSLVLLSACGDGPGVLESTGPPTGPADEDEIVTSLVDLIFVADWDGSNAVPVAIGQRPAWSPDGQTLAFHRAPGRLVSQPPKEWAALGEIHLIGSDGSGERQIAWGVEPAWSSDGTQLVFTSGAGISVIATDGSGLATLVLHDVLQWTGAYDMGVGKPAWEPDGERIVFEHRGADMLPPQIWLTDAEGSTPRRLTTTEGRQYAESDPAWSPDGSQVVFWSFGGGIAVAREVGEAPTSIVPPIAGLMSGAKPVVWGRTGRNLAFTLRDDHVQPCVTCRVRVRTSEGVLSIADASHAVWSPDGSRVAFVRPGPP